MKQINLDLKKPSGNKSDSLDKRFYRILFLSVAAFIILFDLCFILMPDKEMSETENRTLQQFPKLNLTTLTNGKFESAFDTYVADQFPGRDTWVSTKSFVDVLSGKTESNGIYLAKDGYLIQDMTLPDNEKYAPKIQEIRDLVAAHPELRYYALISPTALSIYRDKLPANAQATDENAFYERVKTDISGAGVQFIDVRDPLTVSAQNESDQVFYRTDHHWTTLGAYAAYMKLAQELGLPGKDTLYASLLVSDSFKGTLSASSGFRTTETDPIYVFQPTTPREYTVNYVSEGKLTASFYDSEKLNTRDQYSMFLDGNHPLVRIETNADSRRTLLIFKDSYANCFVPFLAADFRKIVMVDPRYYTDDINSLIRSERISDVLYLYQVGTFAE